MEKMEVFSLEDEDNTLFLMQKDPINCENQDTVGMLGEASDFKSPCVSLFSNKQDQYSDISDDDFQLPSDIEMNR